MNGFHPGTFLPLKCRVVFWVLLLLYFPFKSELRKSETQSQFNNEFSLLNLIECALFRSKIFCAVKVLADPLDARTPGTFIEFWDPRGGV